MNIEKIKDFLNQEIKETRNRGYASIALNGVFFRFTRYIIDEDEEILFYDGSTFIASVEIIDIKDIY